MAEGKFYLLLNTSFSRNIASFRNRVMCDKYPVDPTIIYFGIAGTGESSLVKVTPETSRGGYIPHTYHTPESYQGQKVTGMTVVDRWGFPHQITEEDIVTGRVDMSSYYRTPQGYRAIADNRALHSWHSREELPVDITPWRRNEDKILVPTWRCEITDVDEEQGQLNIQDLKRDRLWYEPLPRETKRKSEASWKEIKLKKTEERDNDESLNKITEQKITDAVPKMRSVPWKDVQLKKAESGPPEGRMATVQEELKPHQGPHVPWKDLNMRQSKSPEQRSNRQEQIPWKDVHLRKPENFDDTCENEKLKSIPIETQQQAISWKDIQLKKLEDTKQEDTREESHLKPKRDIPWKDVELRPEKRHEPVATKSGRKKDIPWKGLELQGSETPEKRSTMVSLEQGKWKDVPWRGVQLKKPEEIKNEYTTDEVGNLELSQHYPEEGTSLKELQPIKRKCTEMRPEDSEEKTDHRGDVPSKDKVQRDTEGKHSHKPRQRYPQAVEEKEVLWKKLQLKKLEQAPLDSDQEKPTSRKSAQGRGVPWKGVELKPSNIKAKSVEDKEVPWKDVSLKKPVKFRLDKNKTEDHLKPVHSRAEKEKGISLEDMPLTDEMNEEEYLEETSNRAKERSVTVTPGMTDTQVHECKEVPWRGTNKKKPETELAKGKVEDGVQQGKLESTISDTEETLMSGSSVPLAEEMVFLKVKEALEAAFSKKEFETLEKKMMGAEDVRYFEDIVQLKVSEVVESLYNTEETDLLERSRNVPEAVTHVEKFVQLKVKKMLHQPLDILSKRIFVKPEKVGKHIQIHDAHQETPSVSNLELEDENTLRTTKLKDEPSQVEVITCKLRSTENNEVPWSDIHLKKPIQRQEGSCQQEQSLTEDLLVVEQSLEEMPNAQKHRESEITTKLQSQEKKLVIKPEAAKIEEEIIMPVKEMTRKDLTVSKSIAFGKVSSPEKTVFKEEVPLSKPKKDVPVKVGKPKKKELKFNKGVHTKIILSKLSYNPLDEDENWKDVELKPDDETDNKEACLPAEEEYVSTNEMPEEPLKQKQVMTETVSKQLIQRVMPKLEEEGGQEDAKLLQVKQPVPYFVTLEDADLGVSNIKEEPERDQVVEENAYKQDMLRELQMNDKNPLKHEEVITKKKEKSARKHITKPEGNVLENDKSQPQKKAPDRIRDLKLTDDMQKPVEAQDIPWSDYSLNPVPMEEEIFDYSAIQEAREINPQIYESDLGPKHGLSAEEKHSLELEKRMKVKEVTKEVASYQQLLDEKQGLGKWSDINVKEKEELLPELTLTVPRKTNIDTMDEDQQTSKTISKLNTSEKTITKVMRVPHEDTLHQKMTLQGQKEEHVADEEKFKESLEAVTRKKYRTLRQPEEYEKMKETEAKEISKEEYPSVMDGSVKEREVLVIPKESEVKEPVQPSESEYVKHEVKPEGEVPWRKIKLKPKKEVSRSDEKQNIPWQKYPLKPLQVTVEEQVSGDTVTVKARKTETEIYERDLDYRKAPAHREISVEEEDEAKKTVQAEESSREKEDEVIITEEVRMKPDEETFESTVDILARKLQTQNDGNGTSTKDASELSHKSQEASTELEEMLLLPEETRKESKELHMEGTEVKSDEMTKLKEISKDVSLMSEGKKTLKAEEKEKLQMPSQKPITKVKEAVPKEDEAQTKEQVPWRNVKLKPRKKVVRQDEKQGVSWQHHSLKPLGKQEEKDMCQISVNLEDEETKPVITEPDSGLNEKTKVVPEELNRLPRTEKPKLEKDLPKKLEEVEPEPKERHEKEVPIARDVSQTAENMLISEDEIRVPTTREDKSKMIPWRKGNKGEKLSKPTNTVVTSTVEEEEKIINEVQKAKPDIPWWKKHEKPETPEEIQVEETSRPMDNASLPVVAKIKLEEENPPPIGQETAEIPLEYEDFTKVTLKPVPHNMEEAIEVTEALEQRTRLRKVLGPQEGRQQEEKASWSEVKLKPLKQVSVSKKVEIFKSPVMRHEESEPGIPEIDTIPQERVTLKEKTEQLLVTTEPSICENETSFTIPMNMQERTQTEAVQTVDKLEIEELPETTEEVTVVAADRRKKEIKKLVKKGDEIPKNMEKKPGELRHDQREKLEEIQRSRDELAEEGEMKKLTVKELRKADTVVKKDEIHWPDSEYGMIQEVSKRTEAAITEIPPYEAVKITKFPDDITEVIDEESPEPPNVITKKIIRKKVTKSESHIVTPPKFVQKLEPQITEDGSTTVFECKVEGNPTPTVIWYHNEIELSGLPRICRRENTCTMEILNTSSQNSGMYTCRATNEAGVASCSASLEVIAREDAREPPYFVQALQPVRAWEGDAVILRCKVLGKPSPTITWYQAVQELQASRDFKMEYDAITGVATLTLSEVFPDDEGVFRCKAVNEHGQAETKALVTVGDMVVVDKSELVQAPKITKPLEAIITEKSSQVELMVEFEGYPTPTVKWYCNGKEILPSRDFGICTQGNRSTLLIPKQKK